MAFDVLSVLAFGFVTWAFFWAGLGAISIPIIIHILNRRRFKTVSWAAMEFLLRAMRKNRRRLRCGQWLLLGTRCSVLRLVATAPARRLMKPPSERGRGAQRSGGDVVGVRHSY